MRVENALDYSFPCPVHELYIIVCSLCMLLWLLTAHSPSESRSQFDMYTSHASFSGIILEYEQGGLLKTKTIDLLDLRPEWVFHPCHTYFSLLALRSQWWLFSRTDVDDVVDEISRKEPLITPSKTDQVRKLVGRLQEKLAQIADHHFYLFKVLCDLFSLPVCSHVNVHII